MFEVVKENIRTEPALLFNGLGELVRLIIPVMVVFLIIQWTDTQIVTVMTLVSFLVGFLSALFTRRQTVTHETANKQIRTAIDGPSTATVKSVIADTEAKEEK